MGDILIWSVKLCVFSQICSMARFELGIGRRECPRQLLHQRVSSLLEFRRCPNHPPLPAPAKLNSFFSTSTEFLPTAKSGFSRRLPAASHRERSKASSKNLPSMADKAASDSTALA